MKPLKPLVLEVTKHLKDLSIFGNPPYPVEEVRTIIRKLCGGTPIQFWSVDYQLGAIGGWFEFYERPPAPYAQPELVALVRFAKSHNLCWRRYVQTKEMCHLWIDEESAHTDTPEKFRDLLDRLGTGDLSALKHEDYRAEQLAALAAGEILFPIEWRNALQAQYDAGNISALRIALMFRLPEFYVKMMMRPVWRRAADTLIYS